MNKIRIGVIEVAGRGTLAHNFHEEHAVAMLEAGKHLFCEKPLAITVEGCDRILQA